MKMLDISLFSSQIHDVVREQKQYQGTWDFISHLHHNSSIC